MELTLAHHPVTEMRFGTHTQLDRTKLVIDQDELSRLVLEDETIESVDFEIVSPGESCRAGPIFDIVQPRANRGLISLVFWVRRRARGWGQRMFSRELRFQFWRKDRRESREA